MDDSIEINLRPARVVAQRLVVLVAMLHRVELEGRAAESDAESLEETRYDLNAWLIDQDLAASLAPSESRTVRAIVGSLSEPEIDAIVSEQGAIEAIAWALELLDRLRSTDDVVATISALPGPEDKVGPFLQTARLRSLAAIATAREQAEVWSWRYDLEFEARAERRALHAEDKEVIRVVLNELAESGVAIEAIDGDFVLDGFPVSEVDTSILEYAAALETQRLKAFNWISGYGTTWDDVPLDIG